MGASSPLRFQDPTEELAPMGRSYSGDRGKISGFACPPLQWGGKWQG